MRRFVALCALAALLSACGASPEFQATPAASPVPTPVATAPGEIPVITAPTPAGGIYEDLPVAAVVQGVLPAQVVENPAQLEGFAGARPGQVQVVAEFAGKPSGFAFFAPHNAAVAMRDDQDRACVYAGRVGQEMFARPLYVAEGEYASIDTVVGVREYVYFVEHGEYAWRLVRMGIESGAAPQVIDQGVGRPPRLARGEGMAYLAELPEGGYEMRVYDMDEEGTAQRIGEVHLPSGILESDRAFIMNDMGFTHTQAQGEGFVAIAENLDGIQTAIGFARRPYQALIGNQSVAWLDGLGAFCAFDPEAESAVSFNEAIAWFSPVAQWGSYLFGNGDRVFLMGRRAEDAVMAVLVLDSEDAWRYIGGSADDSDGLVGYFLRQGEGQFQIVSIQLAEGAAG